MIDDSKALFKVQSQRFEIQEMTQFAGKNLFDESNKSWDKTSTAKAQYATREWWTIQ